MNKVTKRETVHQEGEDSAQEALRFRSLEECRSALDELVRNGAQRML